MVCRYKIGDREVYKFVMPVITSNMYIVLGNRCALVVDPNANEEATQLLINNGVEHVTIILTHEHFDHISGVNYFRERWNCHVIGNKVCQQHVIEPTKNMSAFFMAMFVTRSEEEQRLAKETLTENYSCVVDESFVEEMQMEWEGMKLCLKETPGHSMASICILVENQYIFTGDSLVEGAKIVTKLPGGSKQLYREVTQPFLERLPKTMTVFPGHGEESVLSELEIH